MPVAHKPSNRIARLNSLIQQQVGVSILPLCKDTDALVTVSKVETSRDMKWVKVWISIVGGDDKKILALLQKNIYDIQGELNRALVTKVLPRIQFALDTSPRYAQRINELIHEIHNEDEPDLPTN